MVRVDEEATSPVAANIRDLAVEKLQQLVDSDMPPEVVLIEDYNKGLLTLETIEGSFSACDRANILLWLTPSWSNSPHTVELPSSNPTSKSSTKDSNWQHPFILTIAKAWNVQSKP